MKKLLFAGIVIAVFLSSCGKNTYTCQCVNTSTGIAGNSYPIEAPNATTAAALCADKDSGPDTCYISQ